jgi:hypothetical protein
MFTQYPDACNPMPSTIAGYMYLSIHADIRSCSGYWKYSGIMAVWLPSYYGLNPTALTTGLGSCFVVSAGEIELKYNLHGNCLVYITQCCGKNFVSQRHFHSACKRTKLRCGYRDTGMTDMGWATVAYRAVRVTEMGCAMRVHIWKMPG